MQTRLYHQRPSHDIIVVHNATQNTAIRTYLALSFPFYALPILTSICKYHGKMGSISVSLVFGIVESLLSIQRKEKFIYLNLTSSRANFLLCSLIGLSAGVYRFPWQRFWNFRETWLLQMKYRHCIETKTAELWKYN